MTDPGGGRRRPSYADVMSTIAVFGVLAGGGAYAASKIGSGDIKPNAVRSSHIKNGQVTSSDLAKPVVSGSQTMPRNNLKPVVKLPGIGRIVASCAFGGSGNTQAHLQNRSGKTLLVSVVRGSNSSSGPSWLSESVPDGVDYQLFGTGGATTAITAWVVISPFNNTAGPLASGTVTVEHGCGRVTALFTVG